MGILNAGLSYWQAENDGEPLLKVTIGDLLDRRAAEHPTKEALVYSCYPELGEAFAIRWTYREYQKRVNQMAKGLLALGLQKGDHIAIWATNVPQWPLLYIATAKVGVILVTINPVLRASEIEYILKQGDVRALFFMDHIRNHDCLTTIGTLTTPGAQHGSVSSERLPDLKYACLVGPPPDKLLQKEGWRPALWEEVVSAGTQISDEQLAQQQATITPFDPALIMYTSGTTGFPKGALLSHHSLLNQILNVMRRSEPYRDERMCVLVPFFHIFGNGLILGGICTSSTVYPLLTFDAVKAMQLISQERCTRISFVPTMLLAILQHPTFSNYDLTSLKHISTAGAPVPVALMEQVKERIGANIGIAFGLTESTGPITASQFDDPFERKASTIGKPMPYTEVKLIDPLTGETVACGQRGEICCRGFQVMLGYYKMPELTAEAIDADRWLHTGDLGIMDEQGYVNIVGRLKETIIRGGENIYPREIEEFLGRHPQVADIHVLGVPDAFFGEVLLAVVRPRENEHLTEEDLRAFCAGQISHQKIPRYFQFVTAYPMTGSGKVQKHVLREQAIKAFELESIAKTKTA
jgi:fatty-acyl-CoA synthase